MKKYSKSCYSTFDCHNRTHNEVDEEFEDWLLLNWENTPLKVITGKSEEMRSIIIRHLDNHEAKYSIEIHNPGVIMVL